MQTLNGSIEKEIIKYLRGILQGDSLSVILFILTLNPLSFLLRKTKGYKIKNIIDRISHLFFVDCLKTYAGSVDEGKKQLNIVTTFSKDMNRNFGHDKCAYMYVERGKRKYLNEEIEVNRVKIKELREGEPYKYLGIDESIGIQR